MKGKLLTFLLLAIAITFVPNAPARAHPDLILYVDTSANVFNKKNQIYLDYYVAKSDQLAFPDLALAAGDLEKLSREQCNSVLDQLNLSVGDFRVPFELDSHRTVEELSTTGAGIWTECHFNSKVEFYGDNQFSWRDDNFSNIPGHREFNLGLGKSPSQNLTDYTMVQTLLNELSAEFSIDFPTYVEIKEPIEVTSKPRIDAQVSTPSPSPSVVTNQKSEVKTKQTWITALSNRYFRTLEPNLITVGVGTLFAFLLGALHSIAPGHGKSIMAVMALAEGGKRRAIVKLGLTMGLTHTAGVLALGTLFILGSTSIPRSVVPALGIISGVLICLIGVLYFARHFKHHRKHHHGIDHHHHNKEVGSGRIAFLGIVGGMVPTPSAITILVGTAALGSAWYGVILVASFGIGMTTILIFAGRLVERLFRLAENLAHSKAVIGTFVDLAPIIAASLQVIAGVFLVVISLGVIV